jgi:deazaflavin-dependent oxidoreductase (nitroreductase family)
VADFNTQVIDEFRAHEGRVGGSFAGTRLLLLHHAGAKSGAERINPLAYLQDDGRYVVFASKGGAPRNPGWYYNLKANPDASIEVGTRSLDVTASEAAGEERGRLFRAQVDRVPQFGEYEQRSGRVIPVIILTPRDAVSSGGEA